MIRDAKNPSDFRERCNVMISERRFHDARRGSIVVLLAVASVVLFSFLGLVVDGGLIYLNHQRMTKAADAASLSAAMEMPSESRALEEALQYASLNGFTNGVNDTVVTMTKKPASSNPNWVYVGISKKVPLFFMRILGFNTYAIDTESAAVYYSYLPMSITGTGVYGTRGIQYLSIFGENAKKSYGDPYSPKWEMDGTPNLEFNPAGYNFMIEVPTDYYARNGTNMLAVEIFDADCWNANGSMSPSASGVDEIHLKADGYPAGHPPVGNGYTTTHYSLYAPDDTPNNYDDDVLIAGWSWKEGDPTADTDMQWYSPAGFTFDTNGTSGKYRVNVTSGDGTANNVFHLRSGPPRTKAGELEAVNSAAGITASFTLSFDYYDLDTTTIGNNKDEIEIVIDGTGYRNHSVFNLKTTNNQWKSASLDITQYVKNGVCEISFRDVGAVLSGAAASDWDNDIRNIVVLKDGVQVYSRAPAFDVPLGGGGNFTFQASDAAAPPVYTMEWKAYDWDSATECMVFFNDANLNWQDQGLTSNNGTKTYSVDVTNFVGGDKGSVSVVDNTHTTTNWFSNMVLKKDGVVMQEFNNLAKTEPTAIPTTYEYTGLGSEAGWGEGSQFNPANGTSMAGISSLEMEFVMNGTVNVCLGTVPPEAAGVNLHIQKFDTDVGAKSVSYWDNNGNTWPGVLSGNGTWKEDIIKMPDNYAGGEMYATYQAGSTDTSTWYMWFENSMEGMPGKVRLVK
ncbi:MAG: hypothetical protein CVV64_08495 [Candidatus Wallbacteria bacterium HGW-Wallbacteria-1]|jgi:hypothetical protein|uniref:Putative Flp pilus-assembly TadG-like N-terminal domain-containing protein n=1 Tax=Candidatus Wallbacteria bacterium HGW-Wallbacteria-1 TaxID=2013854 RepID=A0A2N1PPX2_9BACT|nr:MAG: hypothetical protein CVV64_08495 [Candidatus Wallbacteria bacterium HGW-Wallbacteria-1]